MGASAHQALQQFLSRRPFTAAACATLLRLSTVVRLRSSSASFFPLGPCASLPPPAGRRVLGPAIYTSESPCGRRQFSDGVGVRAAAQVNDPGAIDSPLMQSMEKKIKEQLNADLVVVKDAYGDGRHVSIEVVSSAFDGQSAVNRQRMVYKAIWEELQSTVHAVDQMTTRTPAEAAAKGD
ncbi:unnamed protein product [Spirodela intermedia]|uniref:Uncharacterized protein n=2 Tax=Spirodela intermedia TaxID=51605 RepID=A0A7I8L1N5_SPIIN|nr:unnamed protein product [Spirodela intermedia]CAA6667109.1 unnamed protein product [Spirodela intermedia]CAA7403923.1 unnamed protein product [Spirodela intermedia]